jgi:hypothetical protein
MYKNRGFNYCIGGRSNNTLHSRAGGSDEVSRALLLLFNRPFNWFVK